MTPLEAVVARLGSQVARTVYAGAAPDGPLPARYLVVRANVGADDETRLCDAVDVRTASVWVTSVSRNANPAAAHDEAAWGARKSRDALTNWTPTLGSGSWRCRAEVSQPPARDESLSETTFYAVEQFSIAYQL